jgi:hypothetical protein
VVCYRPKTFVQRRIDGNGRRIWNVQGVRQVPYRLPEIFEAIATERRATSILRLVFFVIAHSPLSDGAGVFRLTTGPKIGVHFSHTHGANPTAHIVAKADCHCGRP